MGSRQGERAACRQSPDQSCPQVPGAQGGCFWRWPQGLGLRVLSLDSAVQRTVLADEEPLLDRLREIRQVSGCGHWPLGNGWPLAMASTLSRGSLSALRTQGHAGGQLSVPASSASPSQVPRVSFLSSPFPSWRPSAWGVFPSAPLVDGGWGGPSPSSLLGVPPSLQTSLRQMSQTRFYVAESRVVAPRVSLFVGGLPPGRSPQEYSSLLDEAVASKGETAWAGPGRLARWGAGRES